MARATAAASATTRQTLGDFTHPRLIIPDLVARDVPGVIQELGQRLQREKRIPDFLPFYHAALNREFMGATDLDADMAFPYARVTGCDRLSFALGRSPTPLPWGAQRAHGIRLVFLTAVPAADTFEHLLFFSGLARLAQNRMLIDQLQAATSPDQMLEILGQVKLEPGFAAPAQPEAT